MRRNLVCLPIPFAVLICCLVANAKAPVARLISPPGAVVSTDLSPSQLESQIARLAADGVPAIRARFDRCLIERQRGKYDWQKTDVLARAAAKHRLALVVTLTGTPPWASWGSKGLKDDVRKRRVPADWTCYRAYVKAAALRYRKQVRGWQVWEQPNLPTFRGTQGDYLLLLTNTSQAVRAVDPKARIILSEPGGVDLGFVRRIAGGSARKAFNAIALYPGELPPAALIRPLRVLRERVLGGSPIALYVASWPALSQDGSATAYGCAVATALGVETAFVDQGASGNAALPASLRRASYLGAVSLAPEVPTLLLEDSNHQHTLMALTDRNEDKIALSAPDCAGERGVICLNLEPKTAAQVRVTDVDGKAIAATHSAQDDAYAPRHGGLLVTDLPTDSFTQDISPTPEPPCDRALARAEEVRISFGRDSKESGIYNEALRARSGGAVEAMTWRNRPCVCTRMSPDINQTNPWIYLDVGDCYAFYLEGKVPVEVVVEVAEVDSPESAGFNLCYDSVTGYRFSDWQWVNAGKGWHKYRFTLNDASFANRAGYDLRINAAGSKEDIKVASVTIRKLT